MHLVLVDDEPAILDVLAAACQADGHTVGTFSSSSDALRYLGANPADLLITDIVMPQKKNCQNGYVFQAGTQKKIVTGLVLPAWK